MLTFEQIVEYIQELVKDAQPEQQAIIAAQISAWKRQDLLVTQSVYQHPLFASLMNAIEGQAKFGSKQ